MIYVELLSPRPPFSYFIGTDSATGYFIFSTVCVGLIGAAFGEFLGVAFGAASGELLGVFVRADVDFGLSSAFP